MTQYIATTVEGIEEGAAQELNGKFYSPGRIIFEDYNNEAFLTADIIYELIKSFSFSNLSDLLDNVKDINLDISGSYSCLCKRQGEHDFTSTIIEQDVGRIIGTRNELSYSRDSPDNVIFIDITEKKCNIGILKKKDLSKREYRFKLHNQTTPQLVASCLIKYLNINQEDSILVPECKDGVIPIEASLQGITEITAQDCYQNNIRNAKINAKLAQKEIKFTSVALNEIVEKKDYIICQVIFSKYRKGPYDLINQLFQTANRLLNKKLVIITNHPKDFENFKPENFILKESLMIRHKKAISTVLIYSKE